MRCIWAVMVVIGFSGPVQADDCKIVWWDLFLPQSEAEFEKTSEVSATLTLKNTGKLEPIRFELATTHVTGEDGNGWICCLEHKHWFSVGCQIR